MTWRHIAGLAIAAAVAVVGALSGKDLLAIATMIAGGVFGHAQAERKAP